MSASQFFCQVRYMATLKDISTRLKSVKNIQKITKSMKMVSAAKYSRAERELKPARSYGIGASAFYEKLEVKEEPPQSQLLIAMSSDRGLCGAIHSSVVKNLKKQIADTPDGVTTKIIAIGDKAKIMLSRLYKKDMLLSFNEVGKKPFVFDDATQIAQAILDTEYEFDRGSLTYNKFKSVVSYGTTTIPILSLRSITQAEKFPLYDSVDDEVLQSYNEFSLASLVYFTLKEAATSELSSRMTAMENATKNAGEMIDKLTLMFNRTRQAVITRELIEIISGAAAV